MTGARGYTLVEVLIAVVVFGVLAASAYTALDGLSKAALEHRQRSADLASLQLTVARFDADIRQLTSRAVRAADGRREPALIGRLQSLTGTRAGWANPANLPRSNLQRFGWQYANGELARLSWPVTDSAPGALPTVEPVLDRLGRVTLRYRDAGGGWHEQWPPVQSSESSPSLPTAIELELDSAVFGTVRRLLVMTP